MNDIACKSNDKEIWREKDSYYSDSIHVTECGGGIGINCGGHVIVAPIRKWHEAGELMFCVDLKKPHWKWKLAMWLLGKGKPKKFEKQ